MDVRDWFYNTSAWKKTRRSYIANRKRIDGGMCELCREEVGSVVHHKIALTNANVNNPDISLNHSNLQLVCNNCHEEHHGRKKKPVEGKIQIVFTADGQPVPVTPP